MGMKVYYLYVGHGAMSYLQIDHEQSVVSHFLIDAGSNDDKTDGRCRNDNIELVKNMIYENANAPLVILLTHFHEDHYNLLNKLRIPDSEQYVLLAGSLTREEEFFQDPENVFSLFWYGHPNMTKILLGRIEIPEKLEFPHINMNDAELYCLWNNYFTDITRDAIGEIMPRASRGQSHVNKNGAAYVFLYDNYAFVYAGDMTGANFWALLLEDDLRQGIQELLRNKIVYMTVPHHGSLHTLTQEPPLNPLIPLQLRTGFCNTEHLYIAMREVFQKPARMYISAGFYDKFEHPDYVAAIAYDTGGMPNVGVDARFPVFKDFFAGEGPDYVLYESYDQSNFGWGELKISGSNTFSLVSEEGGRIVVEV